MLIAEQYRFWLAIGLLTFCGIVCVANLRRSIHLKAYFSIDTMRMYMYFVVAAVIGTLALAGAVHSEALTALLGGLVGFTVGTRLDQSQNKSKVT